MVCFPILFSLFPCGLSVSESGLVGRVLPQDFRVRFVLGIGRP